MDFFNDLKSCQFCYLPIVSEILRLHHTHLSIFDSVEILRIIPTGFKEMCTQNVYFQEMWFSKSPMVLSAQKYRNMTLSGLDRLSCFLWYILFPTPNISALRYFVFRKRFHIAFKIYIHIIFDIILLPIQTYYINT